jgi:hypothetical protein
MLRLNVHLAVRWPFAPPAKAIRTLPRGLLSERRSSVFGPIDSSDRFVKDALVD